MSIIFRVFTALFLASVVMAEDATIPYVHLYKICSSFSDNLMIRITCQVASREPLKFTIQAQGMVVSEVATDLDGFIKLPLNEQWISDNAVLHANRPKGTMTMTAKFVVYPLGKGKFSMKDGSFDLMEYLAVMERSMEQIAQLRKIFKDDLDAGISESIPFTIDPPAGASAILQYTINGIEKSVTFPAIDGKVDVSVKGLLGVSAASISVVPKDAKVVFLDSEVRAEKVDHPIP